MQSSPLHSPANSGSRRKSQCPQTRDTPGSLVIAPTGNAKAWLVGHFIFFAPIQKLMRRRSGPVPAFLRPSIPNNPCIFVSGLSGDGAWSNRDHFASGVTQRRRPVIVLQQLSCRLIRLPSCVFRNNALCRAGFLSNFHRRYRFCEGTCHLTWIESQLHQLLTASAKGQQAAPAPPLDIPDLGF